MNTRREALQSLLCGGATAPRSNGNRRNRPGNDRNERLYHGPMVIPAPMAEMLSGATPVRTAARHLCVRGSYYIGEHEVAVLSRTVLPARECACVGEIVRTHDGRYRVHLYALTASARPETLRVDDFLYRKMNPAILIPPSTNPAPPSWKQEVESDISQYLDPQYSHQLMAESMSEEDLAALPIRGRRSDEGGNAT